MEEENALKCIQALRDYFITIDYETIASVGTPNSLPIGSEKWLQYIFYSCLLDYGMKSKLYHARLITTYQKYPQIFDPRYVIDHFDSDRSSLLQIMKENIHPRYPNVALKKWIELSRKIAPYSLLEKIQSLKKIEELNFFVKELGGYGQKTGGLLTRLILESKVIKFSDELTFIPIDRHDIEISYYNGVCKNRNLNPKELEQLSYCWIQAGRRISLNPITVDKYLWEVGNRFCTKKECLKCPLRETCKKN